MPTAKIITYRYIVVGGGLFPFDMLRYDRAWPASEGDSAQIDRVMPGAFTSREIAIRGLSLPTAARWSSFGWEVKATSVKKES